VTDEPGGIWGGGTIRVLYVDDDPQAGDLVTRQLEGADDRFEVVTASSASEAYERLEETTVDCVLSDYDMPDEDGLALLETVRREYGSLPFVLYTARGNEAVASEAITRGVDDYVRKSANRDVGVLLANRIGNAVAGHRARRGYRELFAETADGLALHDPETGAVVEANERYCEIVGRDESAVVGASPTAFTAATDRSAEWFTEQIRGLEAETAVTWHVRRPDGSLVVTEVQLRSVTVGRRSFVLATTREVTDRERTRRRLEAVIEKTDHAVFVKNTDGEYELANEAAAEGLDTTVEKMLGQTDVALVGESEGERIREHDLEVIEDAEPVQYTRRLRTGDGEQVYRNEKYPLWGPDGEIEGLIGVSTDRTGAERRERTLRELNAVATEMSGYESREAVCRRTVEAAEATLSLTNSCVSLAEDGRLVPVAHSRELSAEHVTTMATDEGVLGRSYADGETVITRDTVAGPDAAAGSETPVDSDAATTTFRSAVTVPLGDHGVFQTVAEPPGFFDEQDAELVEILASHARAALDRLDREAALAERNERLEEFASVVSHDLRNPLSVATGRLELARRAYEAENTPGGEGASGGDGETEPTVDDHLAYVADGLDRIDQLIDDLLELTRGTTEPVDPEPVSLAAVAKQGWGTVSNDDATLDVIGDATVRADASRLRQLFENLFRNAVEHGGKDVAVEVRLRDDGSGETLAFAVVDNGPGIPASDRETVFDSGYSTSSDGTGLGLAIVRRVAVDHGWTVTAEERDTGACIVVDDVERAE
jgi:PAS domain S-box-containing protein